jgi:hypothetical protein
MKKSKTIHLVLITAALASCDRVIIPGQTADSYSADASLTAPPPEDDSVYDCSCQLNTDNWNWYNPYDYINNPYVNFNFYYTGQPFNAPYKAGHLYRINTTWRNHVIIVHGGFGKAASAGSSAAS